MSRKLLLADDSITIQKVIQITFAHEDYELTMTDNGDAAFAKAQEIKPDLVMADIYMPGKNGYELCSAIKQDPALQNVQVLLLAGSFEPFDEDKAKSSQANDWIEKPFESQALLDKVNELLSAAPAAESAPEPAAAPVPVAEAPVKAADEAEVSMEEIDLPKAFADESAVEEPAVAGAPMEDPFGDISFDEEPMVEEPVAVVDDVWADMGAEVTVAEASVDAVEDDFTFSDEESIAEVSEFETEEELPVAAPDPAVEEDFTFAEEPVAEAAPMAEVTPSDESDLDVFEDIEEVMPLGDDDILGAEDLELAPDEPTLASWSRGDVGAEDVFAESLSEEPVADFPDITEAPAAEMVVDEEPLPSSGETLAAPAEPVFPVEPVADFDAPTEPVAPVEELVAVEEPAPAAVAASTPEVEAKVAGFSEADIEAIVEKVAGRMIEKLADTILERVAWEVVPDLAENLIREEIRKIKESAA